MTKEETKTAQDPAAAPAIPAAKPSLRHGILAAVAAWWDFGTARGAKRTPDELALDRTDMAATRTLMAADRTLMAWVRTSLSMISFGFTIYKVLHGFQESGTMLARSESPRNIGLFLTGMGILAMVMGTLEYVATLRDLHTHKDFRLLRAPVLMALALSILGVVMFFGIVTKLF